MKNQRRNPDVRRPGRSSGVTLVELMVALAIGSFLIIGAVSIAGKSRHAFRINESIARVQETAQFAFDTIEDDLRMASNWGQTSRSEAIDGRAIAVGTANVVADPYNLLSAGAQQCGAAWALDLSHPVEGTDNTYALPCGATGGAQPNSDVVTIRRATVDPEPLQVGRVQIQSTRIQGRLFSNGTRPAGYDPLTSETHSLIVNSYYVAKDSTLIPGVPTLRRKTLTETGGATDIVDLEVAPGVENMQLQFGVDTDLDNDVDRYVNPGAAILDPNDAAYLPDARIITARIWLVVRSVDPELGIVDNRDYEPGNVDLGVPNDNFRRIQVSKTILLRNART